MKAGLDPGRKRRRGVRQHLHHHAPLIAVVFMVGTLVGAITLASGQTRSSAGDDATAQGSGITLTAEEQRYLDRLGPLTIGADPDWRPFQYRDRQGQFSGIATDLLELVATRLGLAFNYAPVRDWDEAVEQSRAGRIHILHFLNQTPARDEWLLFTEPLLVDPNVFITREEHAFITDATQLTDETIALPGGTSIEERVRRDFPNLTIFKVPTENQVFQAVSNREADLTLRSLTIAADTIRKEGLFNLKIAGQAPEPYVNRLRMGVLKSESMLRDILNKGIASLTPREREEIVNRHVSITIVNPVDYGFILRIAGVLGALIAVSFYWNLRLKTTNAALRESERSKAVLIANLPGVAYRCRHDRDWTMEFISDGCLELTGYRSEDFLHNRRLSFNELILPEDRDAVWQIWDEAQDSGQPVKLEYRILAADRQEKWVFEQGMFVEPANRHPRTPRFIEGLIIDITDRKRAEADLYRVSIHDELTGLHNRRHLMERLARLAAEQARNGRIFSVALIDLDFFKRINDTYGHPAGDFILAEFAAMLEANVRPYDLVGRHGGEEFILVTLDTDGDQTAALLDRLRIIVRDRIFVFEGQSLRITFSAGVASSQETVPVSAESLIAEADRRLYTAKAQGRDQISHAAPGAV
ncbi:diguanylate cyclase [Thiobaca trueperi]|uniref:diguanylate cyclase n=1 Tax=Thiobaca trueperi TaxID=127458 RepID=A0A4R3MZW4_9GAMM|nr:diguanylate cyclase [Thiobaca trueperi]TCT21166.1 PAS domain S-box-containing protein/diguanylate cyclase (GGDEF)-like protein [Thiobaca trueperi]